MILNTIGYQGADAASLICTLKQAGVECLVDVRENTHSRKPGFSKNAISAALQAQGIRYVHQRGLGTPPAMRKAYRANPDMEWFRQAYRGFLATRREDLQELAGLLPQGRCCLLCFEADPAECHRSLIAAELEKGSAGGLEIRHLRVGE
jgi:Uncharacterized conserved protein